MDALARVGAADRRSSELVTLVPGLEIIVTRALGPGDDARDAVQEVLARALAAIEQDRPIHGPFAAFVHGIAVHVIADALRARDRHRVSEAEPDSLPAVIPDALERLIDAQEQEAVNRALALLDPDERDLLRRCYVDGEKTAAIADDVGEPASRIRKRKSRVLQRLRGLLEGGRSTERHTFGACPTRKA
ncbi:MAG: sigma-70 family RNA polymerase sigma factor [Gemmatimonadaceae bacterium]